MILLADSGSTKTDWVILFNKQIVRKLSTQGINPFFHNTESIYSRLENEFSEEEKNKVREIYFYGAGCIKNTNSYVIENALNQIFKHAKVDANDDMLGATRALFGNQSGIACILGTGANSCLYANGKIIDKVPTLGYILGDEGSGAYLGRKLINHYFKRKLPAYLAQVFEKQYNPIQVQIQNAVYKEPNPNRFLASFTPFLKENSQNGYIKKFLFDSFSDFFESNIMQYSNYQAYKLGFIGSIAYHFTEILNEVAESKKLNVSFILEKPIDALILYHISN